MHISVLWQQHSCVSTGMLHYSYSHSGKVAMLTDASMMLYKYNSHKYNLSMEHVSLCLCYGIPSIYQSKKNNILGANKDKIKLLETIRFFFICFGTFFVQIKIYIFHVFQVGIYCLSLSLRQGGSYHQHWSLWFAFFIFI